ncbi:MAG: hypothetical protein JWR32_2318 [Mycobacterium sp.]|nr:hypothetical protein [Mycobacterium sp.]
MTPETSQAVHGDDCLVVGWPNNRLAGCRTTRTPLRYATVMRTGAASVLAEGVGAIATLRGGPGGGFGVGVGLASASVGVARDMPASTAKAAVSRNFDVLNLTAPEGAAMANYVDLIRLILDAGAIWALMSVILNRPLGSTLCCRARTIARASLRIKELRRLRSDGLCNKNLQLAVSHKLTQNRCRILTPYETFETLSYAGATSRPGCPPGLRPRRRRHRCGRHRPLGPQRR